MITKHPVITKTEYEQFLSAHSKIVEAIKAGDVEGVGEFSSLIPELIYLKPIIGRDGKEYIDYYCKGVEWSAVAVDDVVIENSIISTEAKLLKAERRIDTLEKQIFRAMKALNGHR